MFCAARCSRRAVLAVKRIRVRARSSRAQTGGDESPLKSLLTDASSFGEAEASDAELQWATQPYAAEAQGTTRRREKGLAPQDAAVLLFPGQGAERVGMGRQLQDVPAARDLYALASEILGWDVWRVCTEGPASRLAEHVQACVLVTSLAALERARDERPGAVERVRAAAGFSLGELAALVFAGALPLEGALRLAELRTACMAAAAAGRPQGMLTLWLTPDADLKQALRLAIEHARERGVAEPVCQVANYLYPGCKVIAGDEEALSFVERRGASWGVKRAARVRVSGAYHSALMESTRGPLRAALAGLEVRAPRVRVMSCVEAGWYRDATHVRRGLERLAARPVRWEQTLHALFARPRQDAQPLVLALGPGTHARATLRQVNARAWDTSLQIDV